jgi:DNA topoisomerase VI subunit B
MQEAGRKLGVHIRKGKKISSEFQKRNYIDAFLPHVGVGLQEILKLEPEVREDTVDMLRATLESTRKI